VKLCNGDSVKNGFEDGIGGVLPLELYQTSPLSKEKLKGNMQGQPLRGKEVMKKQQQGLYVEGGKATCFVL